MSFSKFQLTILLSTLLASVPPASGQNSNGWPSAGYGLTNSRWGSAETTLNNQNVNNLAVKWQFSTYDDVSATPSVDAAGANVYFPDWSGFIYKVNTQTGKPVWTRRLTTLGFPTSTISRTTPTLCGSIVIMGVSTSLTNPASTGAYLLALNQADGSVLWKTQLDPNKNSLETGSPIIYNNIAYVGVSSNEERLNNPTFRGSLVAVSLANGQILWQTYFVPAGYSGAPIWSGTPVIDTARSQIYVTTGNNYLVPPSVQTCEQAANGNAALILACQDSADYADSVVALDLATGNVKWGARCSTDDAWIFACKSQAPACPNPAGLDLDFGSGPNLFTADVAGVPMDLVGAGQKSGMYWAFNPTTGALVWSTQVGPAGIIGGIQWGTAVDNQRVYAAVSNTPQKAFQLQPSGTPWNGGSWAALDSSTGAFLWQVADPGFSTTQPGHHALSLGPVTVANGVLYCPSMSGYMYALDAATGATLWSFKAPGSVNSGPAVVNGVVYWGSGYHHFPGTNPVGTGSKVFYAFSLPGH